MLEKEDYLEPTEAGTDYTAKLYDYHGSHMLGGHWIEIYVGPDTVKIRVDGDHEMSWNK